MKNIITIDGFASSGKSTLSKLLAKKLNWKWFSSGILYRGLAYVRDRENFQTEEQLFLCIESTDWQVKPSQEKTLFFYKNEDVTDKLYQSKIDNLSSQFSANPVMRKKLIPIQRDLYKSYFKTGLIMEGRDIGTVIFPEAPLKIFLEASGEVRAQRRSEQRQEQTQQDVFKSQQERDKRDKNRPFAPVKKPENCLIFNSEKQSSQQIIEQVYKEFQKIWKPV